MVHQSYSPSMSHSKNIMYADKSPDAPIKIVDYGLAAVQSPPKCIALCACDLDDDGVLPCVLDLHDDDVLLCDPDLESAMISSCS